MLPSYVERRHDQELRACLDKTASGQDATFIMVRGESCTGKSRTAYEAVRACLSDWKLVFPKDSESLLAILAADALSAQTIVWLNEAQEFLSGPLGESAAVALRRRLEQDGPVVIIATLWPAYYRTLTDRPESSGNDPHRQARALLSQATLFSVPDTFRDSALQAAQAMDDSSLRTAIRTSAGGAITQTLAAAPQLVDHYEQADRSPACYAKAVVTAAMDARRLGHASPLSARFLEAAAPGYLTEAQRAAAPLEWFSHAITHARTKVMGVAAALGDVANPDGMGPLPNVYRLADYLDHYARRLRHRIFPPVSFWAAAEQHSASPADLHGLAKSANQRGRFRIAESFFSRAANDGHREAWAELAYFSQERYSLRGAEKLAWKAWEAGFPDPLLNLALLHQEEGNHAEAERLSRAAADTGNPAALLALAQMPEYLESGEEAERLASTAADLGEAEALTLLGRLRMQAGDSESADKLFRQAISAGDVSAAFELMQMWEKAGDKEKAESAARQASDLGDQYVLATLAILRFGSGSREDVERLARSAAELVGMQFSEIWDAPWKIYQGRWLALSFLAALAEEVEHGSGEKVYLKATAEGDLYAFTQLGHYRRALGDMSKAERIYKKSAELGHDQALDALVWMREAAGDTAGAEEICRTAIDSGHAGNLGKLASILEKEDRRDLGEYLFMYGLDLDGSIAVKWQPRSVEPGWGK
ncbi:tetratricopeptide repeat protein [Streptomyces scopuliridis]|uniref:SEL1-like repeat protein n=1 Tax=Streptomyces scopuliridis TaxID=452529 RepID=UPI00368D8385